MLIEILEYLIVPLGVLSAVIHLFYARIFFFGTHPLAKPFSGLLASIAAADAATILFSASTLIGIYGQLHPGIVLSLRLIIFVPSVIAVLFLHRAWVMQVHNSEGG